MKNFNLRKALAILLVWAFLPGMTIAHFDSYELTTFAEELTVESEGSEYHGEVGMEENQENIELDAEETSGEEINLEENNQEIENIEENEEGTGLDDGTNISSEEENANTEEEEIVEEPSIEEEPTDDFVYEEEKEEDEEVLDLNENNNIDEEISTPSDIEEIEEENEVYEEEIEEEIASTSDAVEEVEEVVEEEVEDVSTPSEIYEYEDTSTPSDAIEEELASPSEAEIDLSIYEDIEEYKKANLVMQILYNKKYCTVQGEEDKYTAEEKNGYVLLNDNVKLKRPLYVNEKANLNLNNYTITGPTDDSAIIVKNVKDKDGFQIHSVDLDTEIMSFGAISGFSKTSPTVYVEDSNIVFNHAAINGYKSNEAVYVKNSNVIVNGASIFGGDGVDNKKDDTFNGGAAFIIDWDTNDYTFSINYGTIKGGNGGNGRKPGNPDQGAMLRKGEKVLYFDIKSNIGKFVSECGGSGGDAIYVINENTDLDKFIFGDASCICGGDTGDMGGVLMANAAKKYDEMRLRVLENGISRVDLSDQKRTLINKSENKNKQISILGKAEDQDVLKWCAIFRTKILSQIEFMQDYFDYIKYDKEMFNNMYTYGGLRFSVLQREFDKAVIAYDDLRNVSEEEVDRSYRNFNEATIYGTTPEFVEPTRASSNYGWGYTLEESMKYDDFLREYNSYSREHINDENNEASWNVMKYLLCNYYPRFQDRNDERNQKTQYKLNYEIYEEDASFAEGDGFDINYGLINRIRYLLSKYKKPIGLGVAQYPQDFRIHDDIIYRYRGRVTHSGCGEAHIVTVVGFDDNIPATLFKQNSGQEEYMPRLNGAYIVKNTWGEEVEYVSYDTAFYIANVYAEPSVYEPKGYSYTKQYKKATGYNGGYRDEKGAGIGTYDSTFSTYKNTDKIAAVYKRNDKSAVEKLYGFSFNSFSTRPGDYTVYRVNNTDIIEDIENNIEDIDLPTYVEDGDLDVIYGPIAFQEPYSYCKDVIFSNDIFLDDNTEYFAIVINLRGVQDIECRNHSDNNPTLLAFSNDEILGIKLDGSSIENVYGKVFNNTNAKKLLSDISLQNPTGELGDNEVFTKLYYEDVNYGKTTVDEDYVFRKLVDSNRNLKIDKESIEQGAYLYANGGTFVNKGNILLYIDGEDNFLDMQLPEKASSEFLCWNTEPDGTGDDIYTYDRNTADYNALYAKYKDGVGNYRICFTDSSSTFNVKVEYEIGQDGDIYVYNQVSEDWEDTGLTKNNTLLELYNLCQANINPITQGKEVKRFINHEGTTYLTTNKIKDVFETTIFFPMVSDVGVDELFRLTVRVNGDDTSEINSIAYDFYATPSEPVTFKKVSERIVAEGGKKYGFEIAYYKYKDDKQSFVASEAQEIGKTIGPRDLTIDCVWKEKQSVIKFNTGQDYYIKDIHYNSAFVGDFNAALIGVQRQGYKIKELKKEDGTTISLTTKLSTFYDEGETTLDVVWDTPDYELNYYIDKGRDTGTLLPYNKSGEEGNYNIYTVKYNIFNYKDITFPVISTTGKKFDRTGNYVFVGYDNDYNVFSQGDKIDLFINKYGFFNYRINLVWELDESYLHVKDQDNQSLPIPDFKFEYEDEPVGKVLRNIYTSIQESVSISDTVKQQYRLKEPYELTIGSDTYDITTPLKADARIYVSPNRNKTAMVKFKEIDNASIVLVYNRAYKDNDGYNQYEAKTETIDITYDQFGNINNRTELVDKLSLFYNNDVKGDINANVNDSNKMTIRMMLPDESRYEGEVAGEEYISEITNANKDSINMSNVLDKILAKQPIISDDYVSDNSEIYNRVKRRKVYKILFTLPTLSNNEARTSRYNKISLCIPSAPSLDLARHRPGMRDYGFPYIITLEIDGMHGAAEVEYNLFSVANLYQTQYYLSLKDILRGGLAKYDSYRDVVDYLKKTNERFLVTKDGDNCGIKIGLYGYKYQGWEYRGSKVYKKVLVNELYVRNIAETSVCDIIGGNYLDLNANFPDIDQGIGLIMEMDVCNENQIYGRDRKDDYAYLTFGESEIYDDVENKILDRQYFAAKVGTRLLDSYAREIEIKTRKEVDFTRHYKITQFAEDDPYNSSEPFGLSDGIYYERKLYPMWEERVYSVLLNPEFSEYDFARNETLGFTINSNLTKTLAEFNPIKLGYDLDHYIDIATNTPYYATSSLAEFIGNGDNFSDQGNTILAPIWRKSNKHKLIINTYNEINDVLIYEFDDNEESKTLREILQTKFFDYYYSCAERESIPKGFTIGYGGEVYPIDDNILNVIGYTDQVIDLVYTDSTKKFVINIDSNEKIVLNNEYTSGRANIVYKNADKHKVQLTIEYDRSKSDVFDGPISQILPLYIKIENLSSNKRSYISGIFRSGVEQLIENDISNSNMLDFILGNRYSPLNTYDLQWSTYEIYQTAVANTTTTISMGKFSDGKDDGFKLLLPEGCPNVSYLEFAHKDKVSSNNSVTIEDLYYGDYLTASALFNWKKWGYPRERYSLIGFNGNNYQEVSGLFMDGIKLSYLEIYAGDTVDTIKLVGTIGDPVNHSYDAEDMLTNMYFVDLLSIGMTEERFNESKAYRYVDLEPHFEEGTSKFYNGDNTSRMYLRRLSQEIYRFKVYKMVDENNESPVLLNNYAWADFRNAYWTVYDENGNWSQERYDAAPSTGIYEVKEFLRGYENTVFSIYDGTSGEPDDLGKLSDGNSAEDLKEFLQNKNDKIIEKMYFGNKGKFEIFNASMPTTICNNTNEAYFANNGEYVLTVLFRDDEMDVDENDDGPFNVTFKVPELDGFEEKTITGIQKGKRFTTWSNQYNATTGYKTFLNIPPQYTIKGYYRKYSKVNGNDKYELLCSDNYELLKDITIYVDVEVQKFSVTIKSNEWRTHTYIAEYGKKLSECTDILREIQGYLRPHEELKGYFTNEALNAPYDVNAPIVSNIEVWIKREFSNCNVEFRVKNYTENNYYSSGVYTVPYDTTLDRLQLPDDLMTYREGFTFYAWYEDEDYGNKLNGSYRIKSDMILYGYFRKNPTSNPSGNNNRSSSRNSSSGSGSGGAGDMYLPNSQQPGTTPTGVKETVVSIGGQNVNINQEVSSAIDTIAANDQLSDVEKTEIKNLANSAIGEVASVLLSANAFTNMNNANTQEFKEKVTKTIAEVSTSVNKVAKNVSVSDKTKEVVTKVLSILKIGNENPNGGLLYNKISDDEIVGFAMSLLTNANFDENMNNPEIIKMILYKAEDYIGDKVTSFATVVKSITQNDYSLVTNALGRTQVVYNNGETAHGFKDFYLNNQNKLYYLDDYGQIYTGWVKDAAGNYYFFTPSGESVKQATVTIDNVNYTFNDKSQLVMEGVNTNIIQNVLDLNANLLQYSKDLMSIKIPNQNTANNQYNANINNQNNANINNQYNGNTNTQMPVEPKEKNYNNMPDINSMPLPSIF